MALVTYISPGTDAQLRVTLTDRDGNAITAGTVSADIRNPSGTAVATGVALSHTTGGVWTMAISGSWSFSGGVYTLGEFTALITATYSGNNLVKRVRWPVMFDDNT